MLKDMPSVSTVSLVYCLAGLPLNCPCTCRYRSIIVPAFAGLPPSVQGCAGRLPIFVKLHHSNLQDNPTQEQDQLDVAVGMSLGRALHFPRLPSSSSPQSHYVFMAGITYLYGLWNMNILGDSPVTMMDAHLDVQACLGTLEALSGKTDAMSPCESLSN